jgi:hypothetical protein
MARKKMDKHERRVTFMPDIKFLEWARNIHQNYANHPKWCKGDIGSVSHHKFCVRRYNRLITKLKSYRNGGTTCIS